ncbi:MAG: CRISPR-associated helicase Cas3' [Syntrophomonadaceae bacterium]|nr:CRISPR-associated helicase Cas3' [Syntrophomonadaceae bacterium]
MDELQTKVVWAKKSQDNIVEQWLPLFVHMSDAAGIARLVWYHWLPSGTRGRIARGIHGTLGGADDYEEAALSCFVFLAAAHDLGKATPAFQGKLRNSEFDAQLYKQLTEAGLPLTNDIHSRIARHYWSSQLILEAHGFSRKIAVILGGHHGQPPNSNNLENLRKGYKKDLGWDEGQQAWVEVQEELLEYALKLGGISRQEARSWEPDIAAQVLLSGLVIMVDWIVSNETYFPYINLYEGVSHLAKRPETAWDEIYLPECWNPDNTYANSDLYTERFNIKPRPVQTAVLDIFKKVVNPGIIIIEAPMGEGKTEAALAAAEAMANITGRSGVFFALPTQASANGLFLRFCNWIENLGDEVAHSIKLAHGKADLNEIYNKIPKRIERIGDFWVGGEVNEETSGDAIIVHDWFSGRKKGILADFVIGTIDQVLMVGLKQKHLALRHLGLSNKVVILDECHAYDAYMSQYLYKVLNWLGAYGVPVIVLSATLPGEKRQQLIEAYLNKEFSSMSEYDPVFDTEKPENSPLPSWASTLNYPIITYTDSNISEDVRQNEVFGKRRTLDVRLDILSDDEEILSKLEYLLSEGGYAGLIVNTVKRAQKIAHMLTQHFGDDQVHLLHSRFLAVDRAQKEKELYAKFGVAGERTGRCIVVGTQIFEQSCDLDFDVLITDICPMDLLIQRIGRLHRHLRNRLPKLNQPRCFITGMNDSGFDRGAEIVYGKYLLMNTRALIQPHMKLPLKLPDDIPHLVQETYRSEGVSMPLELKEEYNEAKNTHEQRIVKKVARARVFQIVDPCKGLDDLVGWLDTGITDDPSGKRGEVTVRDTDDSLEVLVVQRRGKAYYMLPWITKFTDKLIPADTPPNAEQARAMAECSIQLPRELCWNIDKTIAELEKITLSELRAWQQSSWLKGELFLVLDEELSAELCGYHLRYDKCYGLLSNKKEKGDLNGGKSI